jgi:hypothetical protein
MQLCSGHNVEIVTLSGRMAQNARRGMGSGVDRGDAEKLLLNPQVSSAFHNSRSKEKWLV